MLIKKKGKAYTVTMALTTTLIEADAIKDKKALLSATTKQATQGGKLDNLYYYATFQEQKYRCFVIQIHTFSSHISVSLSPT